MQLNRATGVDEPTARRRRLRTLTPRPTPCRTSSMPCAAPKPSASAAPCRACTSQQHSIEVEEEAPERSRVLLWAVIGLAFALVATLAWTLLGNRGTPARQMAEAPATTAPTPIAATLRRCRSRLPEIAAAPPPTTAPRRRRSRRHRRRSRCRLPHAVDADAVADAGASVPSIAQPAPRPVALRRRRRPPSERSDRRARGTEAADRDAGDCRRRVPSRASTRRPSCPTTSGATCRASRSTARAIRAMPRAAW